MMEKESNNSVCHSSFSISGGGIGDRELRIGELRRHDFSSRAVDREPGELSSESGSDGESLDVDSGVVKMAENGKRKFSPIIWHREEDYKKAHRVVEARTSPSAAKLASRPPLPNSSSNLCFPKSDSLVNNSEHLVEKVELQRHQQIKVDSLSLVKLSPSAAVDEEVKVVLTSNQEVEMADDYTSTQTIKSSRWANEGLASEDEEITKVMKKKYVTESAKIRRQKSATPVIGELRREGSKDIRIRPSDEHIRSGSSDYMEEDENRPFPGDCSGTESNEECSSHGTPEPAVPSSRTVNMLQGCRSVDEFQRLNKIDEGTYGVVFRARDRKTGEVVALKKVKMEKEREGFPLTALREINVLLSIHHHSIVDVKEVVVGKNLDDIFMVMEYMEHDLKGLMETMKQPFSQSEVKCLMLQLLEGVKYLHHNWVLHRDLKTSNILMNNRGELKICDFGLARQYGSPLKPYTHLVVTLWYRAPELLLGASEYSTAIDMWSLGCIMAELLAKEPLFNGKTEINQLDKIYTILGTPNEKIWPGFSKLPGAKVNMVKHQYSLLRAKFPARSFTGTPTLSDAGFDLLNKLLTYDPNKRITAEAALNHRWFHEVPLPKSKEFMPTFPAQNANDRRRVLKNPNPLVEQHMKELKQGKMGTGSLFG